MPDRRRVVLEQPRQRIAAKNGTPCLRQAVSFREPRPYARDPMLFDPNRWPKPNDMLGSPLRFALASLAFLLVVIVLMIVLPALAD